MKKIIITILILIVLPGYVYSEYDCFSINENIKWETTRIIKVNDLVSSKNDEVVNFDAKENYFHILNIFESENYADSIELIINTGKYCYSDDYIKFLPIKDRIKFETRIYLGFYPNDIGEKELVKFVNGSDTANIYLKKEVLGEVVPANDKPPSIGKIDNWIQKSNLWSLLGLLLMPLFTGVLLTYFFVGKKLKNINKGLNFKNQGLMKVIDEKDSELNEKHKLLIDLEEDRNDKRNKLEAKIDTVTGLTSQVGMLQKEKSTLRNHIQNLDAEIELLRNLRSIDELGNKEAIKNIVKNIETVLYTTRDSLKKETASQKRFYEYIDSFITGDSQKKGIKEIVNEIKEEIGDLNDPKQIFERCIKNKLWHLISLFQKLNLYSKIIDSNRSFKEVLNDDLGLNLLGVQEIHQQIIKHLKEAYEVELIKVKLMEDKFNPEIHEASDYNQLSFFGYGNLISQLPDQTLFDLIESGYEYSSLLETKKKICVSVKRG